MKIPMNPPKEPPNKLLMLPIMQTSGVMRPTTGKGEYLHWDILRHLAAPKSLSHEQWWFAVKLARRALYEPLPFVDKYGKTFVLATPDTVLHKLHSIDRSTGNTIPSSFLNTPMRDSYLVQSLIGEAITSSQLEGASTTRKVAKEMLLTKRRPQNLSEKMIFNNYQAMQFVRDVKKEALTIEIILELHRILTNNTLEDPNTAGELRKSNDIYVGDNRNQILHVPPEAKELKKRLKRICEFANESADDGNFFIHPVIRAVLLHFMLAYDHPFIDGNGRTARALFYWSMAHQGYWLMEFISISEIIKRSPAKYALAYLYTESDENDATYFVIHQLEVILRAIKKLHEYINKQNKEMSETERLFQSNQAVQSKLNYRQISFIKHALKHPNMSYKIEGHRQSHNITYDTARTDLLSLAEFGLLVKQKTGKAFTFAVPVDLKKRIEELGYR